PTRLEREDVGVSGAAVIGLHALDLEHLRRDVVVGDRAGLRLTKANRALTVGRVGLLVARRARLADAVGAGVERDRRPRLVTEERSEERRVGNARGAGVSGGRRRDAGVEE